MRGHHFDQQHQQRAARARTQSEDFREHNRRIASDSVARQRVKLRLIKGSPLLMAADVHQVCLGDIRGHLGAELSEEKRRVLLGRFVWTYIWEGLSVRPKLCLQDFLVLANRARGYVSQGLPLPHPLWVVGVAPEDFRRRSGMPLPKDRPKKLFRAALFEARRHAEFLQAVNDYFVVIQQIPLVTLPAEADPETCRLVPSTSVRGRRRRMETLPQFQHAPFSKRHQIVYGQSRHPFILPVTNVLHPVDWMQHAPGEDGDEANSADRNEESQSCHIKITTHGETG